jgi:hypothetical protein
MNFDCVLALTAARPLDGRPMVKLIRAGLLSTRSVIVVCCGGVSAMFGARPTCIMLQLFRTLFQTLVGQIPCSAHIYAVLRSTRNRRWLDDINFS